MSQKSNNQEWPIAFSQRMQKQLGDQWSHFMLAHEQDPPISVRNHPIKKSPYQNLVDKIPWENSWGRYLKQRPSFNLDPRWHGGAYYVQEASSMLIGHAWRALDLTDRTLTVLDLCAAPGGKSTHLASLLSPSSWLVANELVKSRFHILRENLTKWGYPNVYLTQLSPEKFSEFPIQFDVVLVDAPCSGEGLFRKNAQAKNEWTFAHSQACATRQSLLLESAVNLLKPGGLLIYSTCTYNPKENSQAVQNIQDGHGFDPVAIVIPPTWNIDQIDLNPGIGYQCFPHKVRGEGFFFAILRKPENGKQKEAPRYRSLEWSKYQLPWLKTPHRLLSRTSDNYHVIVDSTSDAFIHQLMLVPGSFVLQSGKRIQSNWVPDPSLATSIHLDKTYCLELDYDLAIRFIRREALPSLSDEKGWHVVQYDDVPLGWVKDIGTRMNNYFPKYWAK